MQDTGERSGQWLKVIPMLVILVMLVILPIAVRKDYWLHILIEIGLFGITALGLRILMLTGSVSFAQASFMAIGGYTSALLVMKLGMSFWLTLFLVPVFAAIVGGILGWPALRLKADYFFLVSFCMGEVIRLFFNFVNKDLFGGPGGLSYIPAPNPLFNIQFVSKTSYFYLVLLFLILTLLVSYSISKSRIGTIFSTLKDKEELSASLGINIIKYKVIAFGISCLFAGLAGVLYAHYHTVVTPTCFTNTQSVNILAYTVVGGLGSFIGPLIGTAFLKIVSEIVRAFGHFEIIFSSIALIVVVSSLPNGLTSLLSYFKGAKNSR